MRRKSQKPDAVRLRASAVTERSEAERSEIPRTILEGRICDESHRKPNAVRLGANAVSEADQGDFYDMCVASRS